DTAADLVAQSPGIDSVKHADAVAHQQARRDVAAETNLSSRIGGTGRYLQILNAQSVSRTPGDAGPDTGLQCIAQGGLRRCGLRLNITAGARRTAGNEPAQLSLLGHVRLREQTNLRVARRARGA